MVCLHNVSLKLAKFEFDRKPSYVVKQVRQALCTAFSVYIMAANGDDTNFNPMVCFSCLSTKTMHPCDYLPPSLYFYL